jgi:pimeloyl-ACP methyl ester carboxylesterase
MTHRSRPWRGGLAILVFFALAAAAHSADAQPARSSTPELLQPHLVDIGGRRMNLVCVGEGSPTLLFDVGAGSNLLTWQPIAHRAEALTRACFYDRAGYGYSDPSPRPMTLDNVTDDLHRLLKAAHVEGPFVLVGHSIGGLYATMYTDRYPDEVAGLVLIDPSFAGQGPPAMTPEQKAQMQKAAEAGDVKTMSCADLARAGKLSPSDPQGCFAFAPGRTPDEIAFLT